MVQITVHLTLLGHVISNGADSWVNNDKSEVGGMTDILFDKDTSEVIGRSIIRVDTDKSELIGKDS